MIFDVNANSSLKLEGISRKNRKTKHEYCSEILCREIMQMRYSTW